MSFAVHTEKLNLISAVASEVNDEKHDAKIQQAKRLKAHTDAATTTGYNHHYASTTTSTTIGIDNDDKDADDCYTSNPHKNTQSLESRMYELECLLRLAIPTLVIQLGSVIPGFTVASYIGRTFSNVTYLAGFTLASVTANLFTLSLLQGLYTASDTLSPQAYGAGNMKEVGYLAIRGFIASMMVVLPIIMLLIIYMKPMLLWIGEDTESATHACVWFRIYAFSIPFYALYQVSMKFLSAQNQMQPLVVCCILSSCIVLPLSLYVFGNLYGFIGTAIAIVVYQLFQSVSLIVYIWLFQSHDPLTWPGLQDGIRNALRWKPFMSYMALGAGGMLASSEWVYWELLSLMIGTFGVVPLSVHTIPTQLIMITFMGPYSLGIALAIRLGATLPVLVSRAKQTVIDTFISSTIVFGLLSIIMYIQQDWLIGLFTTSDAVTRGCHEIWWKVCMYSFCLSIYGVYMGACVGLGMQWTLGIGTFVSLWLLGLPSAYFLSVVRGGGINMAWSTVWPPYVLLPIALTIAIVSADWDKIANDIRIREGAELVEGRRPSSVMATTINHTANNKMEQQQSLLPLRVPNQAYGAIQ